MTATELADHGRGCACEESDSSGVIVSLQSVGADCSIYGAVMRSNGLARALKRGFQLCEKPMQHNFMQRMGRYRGMRALNGLHASVNGRGNLAAGMHAHRASVTVQPAEALREKRKQGEEIWCTNASSTVPARLVATQQTSFAHNTTSLIKSSPDLHTHG